MVGKLAIAALVLAAALPASAAPIQTVQYLKYCREAGSPSLRQTIVIVDEALVRHQAEGQKQADNSPWVGPVLEIADAQENENASGAPTMSPHEQLSIYLARSDSSALDRVFVGCSALPDEAELAQLKQSNSGFTGFVFGDAQKAIAARHAEYRSAVIKALKNIADNAGDPLGKATPSSLIDALTNARRIGSLSDGIPRILLLSTFGNVDVSSMTSEASARAAGIKDGAKRDIDLQRAEVYVSGVAPTAVSGLMKPYLDAFLLASRGLLMGVSTRGELPPLGPAPVRVMVFGGSVDMLDIKPPVQVRIAYDRAGNLLNTWVETTTDNFLATPISGKAICEQTACKITGDGHLMGQAWNPDPRALGASLFQSQYPWAGLRYFNMDVKGKTAHVRIWDPKVSKIDNGNGKSIPDFQFDVQATPDIQF
jgi:hypothetical protein